MIQGPRFSTRAESKWFSSLGWEVINMTNYPESYLARELEMCYVNISLITDYDVGLEGVAGVQPVSHAEVMKVFASNNERVKNAIFKIIAAIPDERTCGCGTRARRRARITRTACGARRVPTSTSRSTPKRVPLLVRNPAIVVVPLLMAVIGVLLAADA